MERELVHFLEEHGVSSARRAQQYCGDAGTADIICEELNSFHIESKGTKSATLTKSILLSWYKQICADCLDKIPVIFNKPNNGEWVGICRLEDYRKIRYEHCGISPLVGKSINIQEKFESFKLSLKLKPGVSYVNTVYAYEVHEDRIIIIQQADCLLWSMRYYEKNKPKVIILPQTPPLDPKPPTP